MKLKCPNCQALLQVPDASAGKVVACRCGKRLRAPAGKSAPVATAAGAKRGGVTRPAARGSAVSAPARRASTADIDAGLFDELTDADLKPVGAVPRPANASAPVQDTGGKLLQQYGVSGSSESTDRPPGGKRPGFLTFIGVIQALWAVVMFLGVLAILGLASVLPVAAPDVAAEGRGVLLIVGAAGMVLFVVAVCKAACCFIPKPTCWFLLLFGCAFSVADRVVGLVSGLVEGAAPNGMGGAAIGFGISLMVLGYIQQPAVRAYYRIGPSDSKMGWVAKIVGAVIGLSLAAGMTLLA